MVFTPCDWISVTNSSNVRVEWPTVKMVRSGDGTLDGSAVTWREIRGMLTSVPGQRFEIGDQKSETSGDLISVNRRGPAGRSPRKPPFADRDGNEFPGDANGFNPPPPPPSPAPAEPPPPASRP